MKVVIKGLSPFLMLVVLLAAGAVSADAQRTRTKRARAPKPKPTPTTVPPLEVRAAREKVSVQLANVTRFVNTLGPVAQAVEDIDADRNATRAARNKNEQNKQKIITAIRNLRDGLSELESEFRTKPALKTWLPSIEGITDLTSLSEDAALAGKFVAAKDPLRDVANRLRDTMNRMPQTGGVSRQ